MIWQVTADELKAKEHQDILRKRISLQRLPSGIDTIINQSIAPIQLLLTNPAISTDRRADVISTCSKLITQYKFDLMCLNLGTIEDIQRGHQQSLHDLQDKLLQLDCTDTLKQAITNRQETMYKRHEVYLKHKLNTFFDQAPMSTSNQ